MTDRNCDVKRCRQQHPTALVYCHRNVCERCWPKLAKLTPTATREALGLDARKER